MGFKLPSIVPKESRRFVFVLASAVFVTAIAIGAISIILLHDGDYHSTPVVTSIVGFAGLAINQLLALARAEQSRRILHKKMDETLCTVQEVKQEQTSVKKELVKSGTVTDERLVETSKQAEREVLAETGLPKTREELVNVMKEVIRDVLVLVVQEAIRLHEESHHGERT